ncbi:MAG: hypothetical protein ACOH2E_08720 [Candidatus Paracaedibacter sp.]
MNKKLPHFFACLSVLGLSVSTYAAEGWGSDWGGGWGNPKKTSSATNTSSTSAKIPASANDTNVASAAASSSSNLTIERVTPSPSLLNTHAYSSPILSAVELDLKAAAPGVNREESFDPYARPVLSFRWMNLINGYPDLTSTNYDTKNRQYYDAATFPSKQPLFSSLKNSLMSAELKVWEVRVKADREAYKIAYQDWQHKEKRYLRKLGEDLAHATKQLETLTDSIFVSSPPHSNASMDSTKKEHKKEEVLTRAKIAAEAAKSTFEEKQKLFLALHPVECRIVEGEQQLVFLTPEELERRFIWGYVEKPLFTAYKTPPRQPHDPNNIKGFLLTDPIDIQIGIQMLSNMITHLEREYGILQDILTRYKRDCVPQIMGLFSSASWSNTNYKK